MTILERLKLELNKQEYFTDDEYTQFLTENTLTSTDTYDKATMQRQLLMTVLDVLLFNILHAPNLFLFKQIKRRY